MTMICEIIYVEKYIQFTLIFKHRFNNMDRSIAINWILMRKNTRIDGRSIYPGIIRYDSGMYPLVYKRNSSDTRLFIRRVSYKLGQVAKWIKVRIYVRPFEINHRAVCEHRFEICLTIDF